MLRTNINGTEVNIEFVSYLGGGAGTFHSQEDVIRIVKDYKDLKSVLVHELTHAYLYYYGFSGAELTEELMCNFMEIYAERIISTATSILLEREML